MLYSKISVTGEIEDHFEDRGNTPILLLARNVSKRITRVVRVCPVFYTLKTQVLYLCYYIKKHPVVPLYCLLMCMYSTKSTHIIIIISTKVQYSTVSVLVLYYCVM